MLSSLSIHNYVLIDSLLIEFPKEMISITGETGAGKSIILGALKLVLGERGNVDFLKDKTKKSFIEARFILSKELFFNFFIENDLDFEEECIIRREINPSGKSRSFINDIPVTLTLLNELSSQLIDIHSQFETSELLKEDYQLQLLDNFSENKEILKSYSLEFEEYNKEVKEIKKLNNELDENLKEADYQLFLLSELKFLNNPINYEELKSEFLRIENIEFISEVLSESIQQLDNEENGIISQISHIHNRLSKTGIYSSELEKLTERIQTIHMEVKDIHMELSHYLGNMDTDSNKKEELQQNLDKINSLMLKHKIVDFKDLYIIKESLEKKTSNSSQLEEKINNLKKKIEERKNKLKNIATILHKNRKDKIPILEKKIINILSRLGMENARLKIELTDLEELNNYGNDHISFLFAANKGKELQSMAKAISGGERSRVMLAIKNIMAVTGILPTLILDEIDTGVSGRIAEEIGLLMKEMAESMQLIVITHLPQVASKAGMQYKVEKKENKDETITLMRKLSEKERIEEIASLISGNEITEAARIQAKNFLKKD